MPRGICTIHHIPARSETAEGRQARPLECARLRKLENVFCFADGEPVDVDLIDYH